MCFQWHFALLFFFFNDTATTEIYTLSLHDALPISYKLNGKFNIPQVSGPSWSQDRKSTRLNSSHTVISYAVFCLKKKKDKTVTATRKTKSAKNNIIYMIIKRS